MATSLENLEPNQRLPFSANDFRDARTRDAIRRLVLELENKQLKELRETINLLAGMLNVGAWYSDLPNPTTGEFPDGAWRMFKSEDGGLEIQKKVDGSWVQSNKFDV